MFDGTGNHLLQPVCLERATLAMIGQQRYDTVYADLGRLLGEPLEPVGIFGRGNGHHQLVAPFFELRPAFADHDTTMFRRRFDDLGPAHRSPAVSQVQRIARPKTQYPHAMLRFLLGKNIRTGVRIELGSVKELHERRILSNFSGGNEFPSQRYDNEPKETKTI